MDWANSQDIKRIQEKRNAWTKVERKGVKKKRAMQLWVTTGIKHWREEQKAKK